MKRLLPLAMTLAICLVLMVTAAGSSSRTAISIVLNGEKLDLSTVAYIENDRTMVPLRDVAEALGLTVTWRQANRTAYLSDGSWEPGLEGFTVVLDPGHGGDYDGANYEGVRECELNLAIAEKTRDLLEAEGATVVMTRTDDTDVSLYARTDLAKSVGAHLFVSIHCNASTTHPDATGIYTAYHPGRAENLLLADTLRLSMMDATEAGDMGSWERAELAVLRTATMPAALVECGYMSTPSELKLLVKPSYQEKLAQGIAAGISAFLTR